MYKDFKGTDMPVASRKTKKNHLTSSLIDYVQKTAPKKWAAQLKGYASSYYAQVAHEDIADRTLEACAGAVLSHWQLAQKRVGRKPIIHIYNPDLKKDGWESEDSIVEIIVNDMPFLVDSIRMEMNRQGFTVNLMIHPIYQIERDKTGKLKTIAEPKNHGYAKGREAFLHIEIDKETDSERLKKLEKDLMNVLTEVSKAVDGWKKMQLKLAEVIEETTAKHIPGTPTELGEVKAFLTWLGDNNFTFLGYKNYALDKSKGNSVLSAVANSGLGVMSGVGRAATKISVLPKAAKKRAESIPLLTMTKSVNRSYVHRPGHMDLVTIRQFDKKGKVVGEHRFWGLYTSTAYRKSPRDIPFLRGKIRNVFGRAKLDPSSHKGKAFLHVLETYPRDELFQISEDELFNNAQGIVHLGDRQRVKLFMRCDQYLKFVSCLVFVPRERYDTHLRRRISEILMQACDGKGVVFNVELTDDALARIEFYIRTDPNNFPRIDEQAVEEKIVAVSQSWQDDFKVILQNELDVKQYRQYYESYATAFPLSFQEDFLPNAAVEDIHLMESLQGETSLALNLYTVKENKENELKLKLYTTGEAIAPSDSLPILENMGVKVAEERPYRIKPNNASSIWVHDYSLFKCDVQGRKLKDIKPLFEDTFAQVWSGDVENDGFNRLVLHAGLTCREIVIVRAYSKYLSQAGLPFSQTYMEDTLSTYANITRMLVDLFNSRFDPKLNGKTKKSTSALEKRIAKALDEVVSLDQDRILRNFLGVILATVRTNYFQPQLHSETKQEKYKSYVSFKFDTAKVPELPDPRPMFEIFVYSPRTEGVHLRGGKVARGGLRWSDRREDFRTEILGLVKAQMVKNSVIVPVGAKGGFVVKQPPQTGGRDAMMQEVVQCYTTFISALLDVTDNIVQGKIVPPTAVVRYDEDDPYLVVAADKGTATFSDIANGIAIKYGFWLGDAFASGGSIGYDHKKMGITARGAWESVKLNFRDLGKNIQKEDFTAVGIGDMAGDVFGNGMLLSKHTQLVAAFNHMHIFMDPNPNSAESYKERKRLFKLPRSSWEDYNSKLISKGGGVFSRSAKSIPISPEMQRVLDIKEKSLAPNKLISAILKAPVDLLWNGGIGTYAKASYEQNSDAGDRSNDDLRINGNELRCKCVGEGGNLGFTQQSRIEYALNGGRIDTDFIHNAGGVDCSDHEVNIKVLLKDVMDTTRMTEKQRVALLADMTDEVADLVLQSNYWQGQAITMVEAEAPALIDEHSRYIQYLERGGLDRALEGLPTEDQMLERKSSAQGLVRPEIAVLVSYAKLVAFPELVTSDLWNDDYFSAELYRYFPQPLKNKYKAQMNAHRLRKEILATFIVNRMVNRMGPTFVFRLQEETGASSAEIARAYTIAWEAFNLRQLWAEISALDNKIPGSAQTQMMLEAVKLIYRTSKWLIQHRRRSLGIADTIKDYGDGAKVLSQMVPPMLEKSEDNNIRASLQQYTDQGVSKDLALQVVSMDAYFCTFDIVDVARKLKLPVDKVTDTYFTVSSYLDIFWLRVKIRDLVTDNHWQRRATTAMIDDLYHLLMQVTSAVLKADSKSTKSIKRIEKWHAKNQLAVDRFQHVLNDLKSADHLDMSMLSVALRELQTLVMTS